MSDDVTIEPWDRTAHRALAGWLADAEHAGIDMDSSASIEKAYEDYFAAVHETPAAERTDPTEVLTMIGIAMGEHLHRRTDAAWGVASDADGPDLALLVGQDRAVFFPANPVADNWNAGLRGWLGAFIDELVNQFGDENR